MAGEDLEALLLEALKQIRIEGSIAKRWRCFGLVEIDFAPINHLLSLFCDH